MPNRGCVMSRLRAGQVVIVGHHKLQALEEPFGGCPQVRRHRYVALGSSRNREERVQNAAHRDMVA